ncbi:hypothetical protein [Domibacillus robiginosus]|uniref:hypothetical protein n=1 Tax=Domibacillus robiginosus TaxID=1071054 RepID=UPI00067B7D16|nr:hypothetical protein [Domibacillus robiginosus]
MRVYVYCGVLLAFILLFFLGDELLKKERATWIWDAQAMRDSEEMLSFLAEQNTSDVYVQIDSSVSNSVYQTFIERAHDQDIQVHALDGSPDYTEKDLNTFLQRVQSLNWDGIHLDIEPYLSENWKKNQKQAVYRYEKLIKQAAKSGWTLGADIPFWYDEIPSSTGESLAEFVIQRTDYTVIMAYRDSAQHIMEVSSKERALGRSLEKDVWIAVETISNPEADNVSFYGKSADYFQEELKKLEDECGCHIAVHHAESWKTLLEQ